MQPLATPLQHALQELGLTDRCDVTVWPTEIEEQGQVRPRTLPELEADAQRMVRTMKPDLVLLTFPDRPPQLEDEQIIHGLSWIMNWSLDFGKSSWDCLVVHPQLLSGSVQDNPWNRLLRQLVQAQDLQLLDRTDTEQTSPEDLLTEKLRPLLQR
jgi:hypothetical protein